MCLFLLRNSEFSLSAAQCFKTEDEMVPNDPFSILLSTNSFHGPYSFDL